MNRTIGRLARAATVLLAAGLLGIPVLAYAAIPPHVPLSVPTDSCAICHRAHTATTAQPFLSTPTMELTGTSLLIADDPARGDVTLCYACHGIGQLGSNRDVQTSFEGSSVHTLAPDATPYGPGTLYCSTCHDPHGTERTVGNSPYPSLLRSYEASTTPIFAGEAYCATCHTIASIAQENEHWSGLAVYAKTAHYSAIATPTSGTDIRCSRCHAPHGSNVAPLLVASIVPTSVVSTFTVTADDRTFCIACHPDADDPQDAWPGGTTYADSSHAGSSVMTTISARWVPAGKRKVGECQVCHAPMGHDDGTGNPVPKLLDAAGRKLCDSCHTAGGVASADTSSQARPVSGSATLVALYNPTSYGARAMLYGGAAGTGPLSGPRVFSVASHARVAASGDVDGDGIDELVVASSDVPELYVYRQDPLTGIGTTLTVPVPAIPGPGPGQPTAMIAIADVLDPLTYQPVPEIVLGDTAGNVSLFELSGATLIPIAGPYGPVAGLTGLTTGNVTGTGLAEVVATYDDGTLLVIGDNGSHGVDMFTQNIGGSPVAPVVADLWNGAPAVNEIAVCDDVAVTDNVNLYSVDAGATTLLAGYTVTPAVGVAHSATAADLLTGVGPASGAELAIAFTDAATDDSRIVVVPQNGITGLDVAAAVTLDPGPAAGTGALIAGDVDGDGVVDLVAGNGGRPSWDATTRAPSTQIWRTNVAGDDFLATPEEHIAGGTELAPAAPNLIVMDLGAIFPSRHPIDAGSGSHNSTEGASAPRHVTCSDCHNSHRAAQAVTSAPDIQGLLTGAWGVGVTYPLNVPTYATPAAATSSYEVCFRCHSSYADSLGTRVDEAVSFSPANASVHAIVAPSGTSDVPATTFVASGGWSSGSVLYCTDCHGDEGAAPGQATDLHESASAPILASTYLGAASTNPDVLCYRCHKYGVYADGSDLGAAGDSYFRSTLSGNLHPLHVNASAAGGQGLTCAACHVSHGSVSNPALLSDESGYQAGAGTHSGSCTNACHPLGSDWPLP